MKAAFYNATGHGTKRTTQASGWPKKAKCDYFSVALIKMKEVPWHQTFEVI